MAQCRYINMKIAYPILKKVSIISFVLAIILINIKTADARTFWLGGDISGVSADEARGRIFYDAEGTPTDLFQLMRDAGMNAVRLRVWVNPADGFCSPGDVVQMAVRARDLGMPVMIDFHYSDWWADPGKQNIPEAWKDMVVEEMAVALADHTRQTLEELQANDVDVKWVQVGNETTHGFLWPVGRFEENPGNYARLTQAGIDAVREIYPEAKVIIHLDNGFDQDLYDRVFDSLKKDGVKWDIIGMSLYPYWAMEGGFRPDEDSTLNDCIDNINHLRAKYGSEVMITEVGYDAREPDKGYDFMVKMFDRVLDDTDGACTGVFYWAPEINCDADYHLGAFANDRPTRIMDSFKYAARRAASIP